jgi:hypothetical protein
MRIKNTLHLGEFWVSPGLLDQVAADSTQELVAEPALLPFDHEGNLNLQA